MASGLDAKSWDVEMDFGPQLMCVDEVIASQRYQKGQRGGGVNYKRGFVTPLLLVSTLIIISPFFKTSFVRPQIFQVRGKMDFQEVSS